MGNFENNIGKFILDIDDQIHKLNREKWGLDWGHECDCKYCDREEDVPEETEQRAAEIESEIKDLESMQRRLQAHADLHGVKVFKRKERKRDKVSV